MALHVILGFDTEKQSASASVIYCGNSGAEARAAEEADTSSRRFLRLLNPIGQPKNNKNYAPQETLPPLEVQPDPETTSDHPPDVPASLAEFGQRKRR